MKTNTPRTDAHDDRGDGLVESGFARTLEQELTHAKASITKLRHALADAIVVFDESDRKGSAHCTGERREAWDRALADSKPHPNEEPPISNEFVADGCEQFEQGIEAVKYIRCMKHREIPQICKDHITGSECAICAIGYSRSASGGGVYYPKE